MSIDCALVQNLLPEYAAGALDGRDRGAIENHLQSCADCRAEADTYVEVADSVLALAPTAEPPIGFEAGVLARLDTAPQRRVRRTAQRVLAAAAAVLAVGLGIGRLSAPAPEIRSAALTAQGNYVGKAWVHRGNPGWIYVDMRYRDTEHVINLEVVDHHGGTTKVGQLVLRDGHGTLGARSPIPVSSVHTIRMREDDGTIVCQAVLA